MKALTVAQPWASLIVAGVKTIETRPSPPNGPMRPDGVRGLPGLAVDRGERIAIHAAAAFGGWSHPDVTEAVARLCRDMGEAFEGWHRGAIVGTVVVDDALPIVAESGEHDDEMYVCVDGRLERQTVVGDPWIAANVRHFDLSDQLPLGDFTPGRWAWITSDPEPCEPIPVRGRQGVWAWDGAR